MVTIIPGSLIGCTEEDIFGKREVIPIPYKRIGKTIYTKSSGKWRKKQTASSIGNAIKALRLLRGIEHGTLVPRREKT